MLQKKNQGIHIYENLLKQTLASCIGSSKNPSGIFVSMSTADWPSICSPLLLISIDVPSVMPSCRDPVAKFSEQGSFVELFVLLDVLIYADTVEDSFPGGCITRSDWVEV